MKAKFISTDGPYLEASISAGGQTFCVMDQFEGKDLYIGDEIDVEISAGLYDENESWETIFNGNPQKEKKIEPLGGWRYRVFGVVCSVSPVLVDAGQMQLEIPVTTHDEKVIGEFIAFRVERLDASR